MKRYLAHHLKLRMLTAIDAIAKHQSLLRASKSLGVTQPALTRTLREVEEILGGKIFERRPRGVALTEFGDIACISSRRILAEIDRLDRDLNRFDLGKTSLVALGAMPPAVVGVLPGLFSRLQSEAPHIHVQLTKGRMEELIPLLSEGELDLIFGRIYQPNEPDEFVREVLYREPLAILARMDHPLFRLECVTVNDLNQFRFALPVMSSRPEQEVELTISDMSLTEAVAYRDISLTFLRELLLSSDHLTIAPPLSLGGDILRGTVQKIPIVVPGPPRPAGILIRRDRQQSQSVRKVLELAREHIEEIKRIGLAA